MDDRPVRTTRSAAAALLWIFAAFGAVVIGVAAGALFRDHRWAWVPPLAGFVVYVLAFRQGLRCRGDFDEIWRATLKRQRR